MDQAEQSGSVVGVVGLGNMGGALAANLAASGFAVLGHDAKGPTDLPPGVTAAADVAEVARRAGVIVLSLPDGAASAQVCGDIGAAGGRVTHVVDTSTVGVEAARGTARQLAGRGIGYVDAPVSGGVAGAKARTLTVIYAGSDAACAHVEPVLAGLGDRRRRVGDRPGLARP